MALETWNFSIFVGKTGLETIADIAFKMHYTKDQKINAKILTIFFPVHKISKVAAIRRQPV